MASVVGSAGGVDRSEVLPGERQGLRKNEDPEAGSAGVVSSGSLIGSGVGTTDSGTTGSATTGSATTGVGTTTVSGGGGGTSRGGNGLITDAGSGSTFGGSRGGRGLMTDSILFGRDSALDGISGTSGPSGVRLKLIVGLS